MLTVPGSSTLVLLAALAIFLRLAFKSALKRGALPPGPKGLPFIGNVFQMPRAHAGRGFAELSKKYGDLVYMEVLGHRMIVIDSQDVARDLLEKRGARYSNRPRMVRINEVIGWDPSLMTLQYKTESFRRQRRWLRGTFGEKHAVRQFAALQQRETCVFLLGMISTPDAYAMHVRRFVSAVIVDAVYGHRITSLEDPYVMMMDRATEASTAGTMSGSVLDIFPFLKHVPAWMPGASFMRDALHARALVLKAHQAPYQMCREIAATGNTHPSFTSALVERAEKAGRFQEEERDIIGVAGLAYGAASDTTKTVLLAMVLHSDVFAKAQEEVDRVVGRDRLPTQEDRPSLPFVECILKETYRWNPPVGLGVPHQTSDSHDEYGGYHIPADTTMITNIWSISRNTRNWEDSDIFRPERFLKPEQLSPEVADPKSFVFGHGRRLCPGREFADATLFLAISNMIAALDIGKSRDAEGNEITPKAAFASSSIISYPEHFSCSIKPRFDTTSSMVLETLANVPS
ncbi:cytochrome P450 [Fomitopsis betulina]|nr:cytochrome P450 [Fomitopsis betulina]